MLATVIFKIGGGDHVKCTLILFGGRTFRGFEASVSKNIAEAGVTLTVPLGQYNHMANCLVRLRQRWKIVESEHASKTHTIAAMMRNAVVSVGSESFVAAQLLLVMAFLKLLGIAIYSSTPLLLLSQSNSRSTGWRYPATGTGSFQFFQDFMPQLFLQLLPILVNLVF